MNSQYKISIIVPIYNTPEKEFKGLLDSLSEQCNDNIEVLIINDGCDKDYASLINAYSKYIRIFYYIREHSGVSETRNYGIHMARGEYLMFADADDIIPENTIATVIEYIEKYNEPDAIFGKMQYLPEPETDVQNTSVFKEYQGVLLYEIKRCIMNITPREETFRILGTQCGKIYKREIALKTGFNPKVSLAEDQLFNLNFISNSNRIVVIPDTWYIYLQNEYSVSHTKAVTNYWDMIRKFWDGLYEYAEKESEAFKEEMIDYFLSEYYSVPKRICLLKGKNYHSNMRILKEAAMHPIIADSIKKYKFSLRKRMIKNVKFILLKIKAYLIIYLIGMYISRKN